MEPIQVTDLAATAFKLWDPVGTIVDAIQDWQYGCYQAESDAEKDLLSFLQSRFPNLDVRSQVTIDRARVDILVERKVAIELKVKMMSSQDFQRLMGQLEEYSHWNLKPVVVVLGPLDDDYRRRIARRLRKDFGEEDSARLVHLPPKANAT